MRDDAFARLALLQATSVSGPPIFLRRIVRRSLAGRYQMNGPETKHDRADSLSDPSVSRERMGPATLAHIPVEFGVQGRARR